MRHVHGLLHRLLGNRVLNIARRLRFGARGVMEMHTMVKAEVLERLASGGMTLVEVERSNASGTAFLGFRYFAVKR